MTKLPNKPLRDGTYGQRPYGQSVEPRVVTNKPLSYMPTDEAYRNWCETNADLDAIEGAVIDVYIDAIDGESVGYDAFASAARGCPTCGCRNYESEAA